MKFCEVVENYKLMNSMQVNVLSKVTVQFETERIGKNEIVSHMDRSEVKL